MNVHIQPVPEQNYEGRQWGYEIVVNGVAVVTVSTGGSGPCWNFGDPEHPEDMNLHICELDDLIVALHALRDSDVFRDNYERWGITPPAPKGKDLG